MDFLKKVSFQPKLITSLKGYNMARFKDDVIAGIVVGIVALPLAVAFGIASGVTPTVGLITAVIGGFLVSALGGCSVQIGGPTGAFIVIIYGIIQQFGLTGLAIATVLAGLILVALGLFRLGTVIKFIPYPIVIGFTSGIAVTIFSTQITDFFGLQTGALPADFISKWGVYMTHFGTTHLPTLIVGIVSLAIIIAAPYVSKHLPGALLAIIVVTAAVWAMHEYCGLEGVETIGDRFHNLSGTIPSPHSIDINIATINALLPSAFTIAMLGAIESLLSATVADGATGSNTDCNTELIGQGVANVVVPFFGGIPVTGAIARTMTNITNGGRTPVAGMVHSITLVIVLVVLMPFAGMIPMPTIAAILFIVAYNMCQWRTFVHLIRTAPKSDIIVLFATFILTILFDLVVAIEIGMVLACLLFIKRMSEETHIDGWTYVDNDTPDVDAHLKKLPLQIRVYEITGPLFFGAADAIEHIVVKDFTTCLVLRMRSVPAIDSTAMNALFNLTKVCENKGITLVFSHVNEQPMKVMEKAGFVELVGRENFCPNISAALAHAEEISI